MSQFFPSQQFEFGDTWPVGSFRLKKTKDLLPEIISHFDVPGWPELTALGTEEELVGFWLPMYEDWEEHNHKEDWFEEKLLQRPGMKAFLDHLQGSPLSICKGQMIGPVTLIWALKKNDFPVIDRFRIGEFLKTAFRVQAQLCSKVSHNVIISLDEPCAFMNPMSLIIWEEFFSHLSSDSSYGVAMHSCGAVNPDWLKLNWDVIHVDFEEFLQSYQKQPMAWQKAIQEFFDKDKWLALGVVRSNPLMQEENMEDVLKEVISLFKSTKEPKLLLSTSCGMGDVTLPDTVNKLQKLSDFAEQISQNFLET